MSTVSIHPVEYLRLHLHHEEVKTRLRASLESFFTNVGASVERATTAAVVLLVAALVIFGCMKIGASASVEASYSRAIAEIVLPAF